MLISWFQQFDDMFVLLSQDIWQRSTCFVCLSLIDIKLLEVSGMIVFAQRATETIFIASSQIR
jgi:hypothetical protein